jgi:RNA polymerase sigma factor FliA
MDLAEREKRARESMPLIDQIVRIELKKLGFHPKFDKAEIRSYALEGLAVALDRYDPALSASFKAYAKIRIRGAIYDGLCRAGWFPRRLKRRINFYRKSEEILLSRAAESAPKDQVEAVHRLADTLKDLAAAYVTSLSALEEEPEALGTDADDLVEHKRFAEKIKQRVEALPPKHKDVVTSYFYREMTLEEIAQKMNISKSWASKLLSSGLVKLRKTFDGNGFL